MPAVKAPTRPTCPLGLCRHALIHHDRDEKPGPAVERCTVQDCTCSGPARQASLNTPGVAA